MMISRGEKICHGDTKGALCFSCDFFQKQTPHNPMTCTDPNSLLYGEILPSETNTARQQYFAIMQDVIIEGVT